MSVKVKMLTYGGLTLGIEAAMNQSKCGPLFVRNIKNRIF